MDQEIFSRMFAEQRKSNSNCGLMSMENSYTDWQQTPHKQGQQAKSSITLAIKKRQHRWLERGAKLATNVGGMG